MTQDEINQYIAAMTTLPDIGTGRIRACMEELNQDVEKVCWQLIKESQPYMASEASWLPSTLVGQLKRGMEACGCQVISYKDKRFPSLLQTIYQHPVCLFYIGNIDLLADDVRRIGMVGARKCTPYGRNVALSFSQALSQAGVVIVSGGAYGVDTYAHEGTLRGGGQTIAVMGCGLHQAYPARNKKLFRQIVEQGGLLLSEYAPGMGVLPHNFPVRNRIISGLSKAVVVVEARARSGSLITADMAVNDGRDVFAVPGNVLADTSAGNHWLLRQGALLATSPEDILQEYGWLGNEKSGGSSGKAVEPMVSLTTEEKKVIAELSTSEEVSLQELVNKQILPLANLHVALLSLEMKKQITRTLGNGYILLR